MTPPDREALDARALREHLAAHPTPPSGPPPAWEKVEVCGEVSPPKTTAFRKRDGSPLVETTLRHTFSKMTGLRRGRTSLAAENTGLPACPFCGGELCPVVLAADVGGGPGVSCGACGAYTSRLPWREPWLYEGRTP